MAYFAGDRVEMVGVIGGIKCFRLVVMRCFAMSVIRIDFRAGISLKISTTVK